MLLREKATQTTKEVTKKDVGWVFSLLANALTIHVSFARPGLFQGLTVSHGLHAVKHGVVGSSRFKTANKYGLQSLYFDEDCKILLKDWLEVWRPILADGVEPDPGAWLFINAASEPIEDWSRRLSLLWELTYSRQMNSTILRYWKATKVALSAGTEKERKMVIEADW